MLSGRSSLGPRHRFTVPVLRYWRALPSPPAHRMVVSGRKNSRSSPASHQPAPNGLSLRFTAASVPFAAAVAVGPEEYQFTTSRVYAYTPVARLRLSKSSTMRLARPGDQPAPDHF